MDVCLKAMNSSSAKFKNFVSLWVNIKISEGKGRQMFIFNMRIDWQFFTVFFKSPHPCFPKSVSFIQLHTESVFILQQNFFSVMSMINVIATSYICMHRGSRTLLQIWYGDSPGWILFTSSVNSRKTSGKRPEFSHFCYFENTLLEWYVLLISADLSISHQWLKHSAFFLKLSSFQKKKNHIILKQKNIVSLPLYFFNLKN